MNLATQTVRAGIDTASQYGDVMPPLHLSTNFSFANLAQPGRYDYTRSGNPTRDELTKALNRLEGGAAAVSVASGMAAVSLVTQLLRPDDLIIVTHDCYGGTHRLFTALAKKGHFRCRFVDLANHDTAAQAFAAAPAMVWIETPSNPLLRLTDIATTAERARACGALLVVDNTFLSPTGQQPLQHGADIVVHSTTKYLNGHSDVVGGVVIAEDEGIADELSWWANAIGSCSSPFDCWLTLRGLRTLHARTKTQAATAAQVAAMLAAHPGVSEVHYPGLSSHPQRDLAEHQHLHHGGMLSLTLTDSLDLGRFVQSLRYFSLAESLGGVESLIAHPASMTHAAMEPRARAQAGISDHLLRLSIGLETLDDLCDDLRQALVAATPVRRKVG